MPTNDTGRKLTASFEIDTEGKFTAGVNDIGGHIFPKIDNDCSSHSGVKFATSVNDPSGEFAAGVNDDSGEFSAGVNYDGGEFSARCQ